MGNSNKVYRIYYSVLAMALTLGLLLWINEFFALRVHIIACSFYSLVLATLIFAFDKYRKNGVSYFVLLSLLPLIGLIFLFININPIKWLKEIIEWVRIYDSSEELYSVAKAHAVMVIVAIFTCILFFLLVKRFVSRLFLSVFILAFFIISSIREVPMGKIVVGIGIFFITTMLIEFSGVIYSKRFDKEDKKESLLYLLPVCFILTVIVISLPSKADPIQWTGLKKIYYSMQDGFDRLITEWEFFTRERDGFFSISLSGFSQDGSLDNKDLENNNRIALIVKGRRGLSPIYLTGSVSDIYTGHSWERTEEDYIADEEEYQLDYGELLLGLSRMDPTVFGEKAVIETKSIHIAYKHIRTKTFFYPLKSRWYQFDGKRKVDTKDANITFPKSLSKASYDISYYELNLQEESLKDLLRSSDKFTYEGKSYVEKDTKEFINSFIYVRGKDHFIFSRSNYYEIFSQRAKLIKERYSQLPKDLPIRVKELAYDITKDQDSNYDKLKAIETYLIDYTYSYTPGKVPEGSDFVDYFLFDNKRGYCTSFATAMAVLGRCIGIPTRYVEGYVVDYNEKSEQGFIVRNTNAHAWAEAYFEGVGWIPFEATPSLHEERYSPWASPSNYVDYGSSENHLDYDPSKNYMISQEEEKIEEVFDYELHAPQKEDKFSKAWGWIIFILITLLLLVLALVVYYLILRRAYMKEMEEATYSNKMYLVFIRILHLLKFEGFVLGQQETLLMLADRIGDRYIYNNITFTHVANIFMSYRYGEIGVKDAEFDMVNTFYHGLMDHHKNESKPLKLHLEELVFLVKRRNHKSFIQD